MQTSQVSRFCRKTSAFLLIVQETGWKNLMIDVIYCKKLRILLFLECLFCWERKAIGYEMNELHLATMSISLICGFSLCFDLLSHWPEYNEYSKSNSNCEQFTVDSYMCEAWERWLLKEYYNVIRDLEEGHQWRQQLDDLKTKIMVSLSWFTVCTVQVQPRIVCEPHMMLLMSCLLKVPVMKISVCTSPFLSEWM